MRKNPHYTDIEIARWREYEDVLTDSLWLMSSRHTGNGHKLDYHGNFIPQIANQMFRRYTKEGEIVVDWFLGSGTSAIEAVNLSRKLVGVELKPELLEHVAAKLPEEALEHSIRLLCGDSTNAETADNVRGRLAELGSEKAHLAILHPPYADIIRFSEHKSDLSNCTSIADFLDSFQQVAQNAYDTLENGRFAVLVIGDKYSAGELEPLGFKCMQRMNDVGFKTKSIIVKNIEGNEVAKGKDTNLWRYRALAGGFYIFKHEYVIVFFK